MLHRCLHIEAGCWPAAVDRRRCPTGLPASACRRSGELFLKPSAEAVAATLSAAAIGRKQLGGGGGFRPPAGAFKRPGLAGGAEGAAAAARAGTSTAPAPRWLHDPTVEGATVLNAQQWNGGKGQLAGGRPVCPVVVDSYIARHLRPHQVAASCRSRVLTATRPAA